MEVGEEVGGGMKKGVCFMNYIVSGNNASLAAFASLHGRQLNFIHIAYRISVQSLKLIGVGFHRTASQYWLDRTNRANLQFWKRSPLAMGLWIFKKRTFELASHCHKSDSV